MKRAPQPPDPVRTARAQADANREAALESARINQVGQVTPWGRLDWSGTIGGPDRTQTVTLAPAAQALLDHRMEIGGGLLGLARGALLPQLRASLAGPPDFSGLPRIPGREDLEAAARPLEEATWRRGLELLRPEHDRRRAALESTLANRGIPLGSAAHDDATGRLDRAQGAQLENLALASVGAGRAEQSRLFGLQRAARRQALQELLTRRVQPVNELAALLRGAPAVRPPAFPGYASHGVPAPDIAGLARHGHAIGAQATRQADSDLLSGLFGLGGAAIMGSDRRLKTGIRRVGRLENGLAVYAFRFKGRPETRLGLMADEVARLHPEAVIERGGYRAVDYARAVQPAPGATGYAG